MLLAGVSDGGMRLREHAAVIGEVEDVTVLVGVVDQIAAAGNGTVQPLGKITHVDFDGVHQAANRAGRASALVLSNLAFARFIKINGIPVVLGAGTAQCIGIQFAGIDDTIAVPIGRLLEKNDRFGVHGVGS